MHVNRYKYFLDGVLSRIGLFDFELIKYVFLSIILIAISLFFLFRIFLVLEEGSLIESKLSVLKSQVNALENENRNLIRQKEYLNNNDVLEKQYRSMGYQKKDESVYVIAKSEVQKEEVNESKELDASHDQNRPIISNWILWMELIFG